MRKPKLPVEANAEKHFRRLDLDELVTRGDFILNEQNEFDLWEGPIGFRADAFVRPIYRQGETHVNPDPDDMLARGNS